MDLQKISIFSPLLPILVFCLLKPNWKQKLKWVVFTLLVVGVIVDVYCMYLAKKGESNIHVVNIFAILECAIITFFFYLLFQKNKVYRTVILVSFALFCLFWVGRNLLFKEITTYDSASQAMEFILLFLFCLSYFFQKAKVSDTVFIYSTYEFWIVSAILIYCAGTFFSFFIPSDAKETTIDTKAFEYISRVGNILKNLLLAIAFSISNKNLSNHSRNPNSIYYINDLKD